MYLLVNAHLRRPSRLGAPACTHLARCRGCRLRDQKESRRPLQKPRLMFWLKDWVKCFVLNLQVGCKNGVVLLGATRFCHTRAE